jgi:hypothetical protein
MNWKNEACILAMVKKGEWAVCPWMILELPFQQPLYHSNTGLLTALALSLLSRRDLTSLD